MVILSDPVCGCLIEDIEPEGDDEESPDSASIKQREYAPHFNRKTVTHSSLSCSIVTMDEFHTVSIRWSRFELS